MCFLLGLLTRPVLSCLSLILQPEPAEGLSLCLWVSRLSWGSERADSGHISSLQRWLLNTSPERGSFVGTSIFHCPPWTLILSHLSPGNTICCRVLWARKRSAFLLSLHLSCRDPASCLSYQDIKLPSYPVCCDQTANGRPPPQLPRMDLWGPLSFIASLFVELSFQE